MWFPRLPIQGDNRELARSVKKQHVKNLRIDTTLQNIRAPQLGRTNSYGESRINNQDAQVPLPLPLFIKQ